MFGTYTFGGFYLGQGPALSLTVPEIIMLLDIIGAYQTRMADVIGSSQTTGDVIGSNQTTGDIRGEWG